MRVGFTCGSDRLVNPAGYVAPGLCQSGVCPYYNVPNLNPAGAGDYVHRAAHALKIDAALDAMGIDCGCAGRKKFMNELLPLP